MKVKSLIIMMLLISVQVFGQWEFREVIDNPMTNEVSQYARTPYVEPIQFISRSYADLRARLGVISGSNSSKYIVYIEFSESIILKDSDLFYMDIKFDNEEISQTLIAPPTGGANFVLLMESDYIVTKIKEHNKLIINLPFYGNRSGYFEFSLVGATKQINKLR